MSTPIKMRCACGATLETSLNTYINAGGRPDVVGRQYVSEVYIDKWLSQHARCCGREELSGATVPVVSIGDANKAN